MLEVLIGASIVYVALQVVVLFVGAIVAPIILYKIWNKWDD